MTNRNTLLSNENMATGNAPFLLKPVGKAYLWGGRRLRDDYAKEISLEPLAETWECSTHPNGPSMVASGPFIGMTLTEVLNIHPEFLGVYRQTEGKLPILIKFIDAKKDLSIQVHPDDSYAKKYENGQLGKSEMWYILDAEKGANLIYGLQYDLDADGMRRSIANGTIEKYLRKIPVKKDDIFFVEAGMIHAIGQGCLIAEVQENSDLTYRLYDYDRLDKDGRKRPLHVEKALEVANLKSSTEPRQPMRVLRYRQGYGAELLCRCKYFEVYRLLVNTERCRELASYQTDNSGFHVLLCLNGCGFIQFANDTLSFFKGDCIFVPADSLKMRIHGKAQFLEVRA